MAGDTGHGAAPDPNAGRQPRQSLMLEPIVSWPDEMTADRRHLVEVDLALVTAGGAPAPWPLQEEEYAYTCVLDGGGVFDWWAVNDSNVVLHCFGGSYGSAKFVVTPREKPGSQALWLTIFNAWGVPVGSHELQVQVRASPQPQDKEKEDKADGEENQKRGEKELAEVGGPPLTDTVDLEVDLVAVPAFAPAAEGPSDLGEDAVNLAMGDQMTIDIPVDDLPQTRLDEDNPDRDDVLDLLARLRPVADLVPVGGSPVSFLVDSGRPPVRTADRLAQEYNLAALRRSPSGNLHWEMVPLFSASAARGDRVAFTVCCPPSDEHGTAFALFAEPSNGSDQSIRLMSVQSANVPPGVYRVTAELRPQDRNQVRFDGLPVPPREDRRRWPDILAAVPSSLAVGTGPVHLIMAIEISGAPDVVRERIDAARRLVSHVADEAAEFVCYSLITYGPHSISPNNRLFAEEPVRTLAWAEAADDVLQTLNRVYRRPAAPLGYEGAAQLECVLTDLERGLTGGEGRPMIVVIGARPPHPPRVDASQIIPCRYRHDWTASLDRLRARYQGIVFRGIRDSGRESDPLWQFLSAGGRGAGGLGAGSGASPDYFTPGFAESLGLTGSAAARAVVPIPVPLVTPAPFAPLPSGG
jgi:hypothetical protein